MCKSTSRVRAASPPWCELSKSEKLVTRRRHRAYKAVENILKINKEDLFTTEPSRMICLVNGGADHNTSPDSIIDYLGQFGQIVQVSHQPGRPHCYVVFELLDDAVRAQNTLDRKPCPVLLGDNTDDLLYVEYSLQSQQSLIDISQPIGQVPDLILVENFVSEEEENQLLVFVDSQEWTRLANRRVQHYGAVFNYTTNYIDESTETGSIPPIPAALLKKVVESGHCPSRPTQLTVNEYMPGSGIAPHADTHSAFCNGLVSVSLGASSVMDFRHPDGRHIAVPCPRRSLMVMNGESQFGWTHGISQRKFDLVDGKYCRREKRVSFTFRQLREGPCNCIYPTLCDSQLAKGKK